MLTKKLHDAGVRSDLAYGASLASIGLCIGLWIRAKTVDQDERGNAERRALFVGLWPPMFWLIGDSVGRYQEKGGSSPAGARQAVIAPMAMRSALPGARSPRAARSSRGGAGRPNSRCPNSPACRRSARPASARVSRQPEATSRDPCHSSHFQRWKRNRPGGNG